MLDDNEKQRALIKLVNDMEKFLVKYTGYSPDKDTQDDIIERPILIVDKLTKLTGYDIISMIQLLNLTLKNLDERTEVFMCPVDNEHCTNFHNDIIHKSLESAVEHSLFILCNAGFNKLTARYIDGLIKNTCEYFSLKYDYVKHNVINMLEYCEYVFENYEYRSSETRIHLNKLYEYLNKETD